MTLLAQARAFLGFLRADCTTEPKEPARHALPRRRGTHPSGFWFGCSSRAERGVLACWRMIGMVYRVRRQSRRPICHSSPGSTATTTSSCEARRRGLQRPVHHRRKTSLFSISHGSSWPVPLPLAASSTLSLTCTFTFCPRVSCVLACHVAKASPTSPSSLQVPRPRLPSPSSASSSDHSSLRSTFHSLTTGSPVRHIKTPRHAPCPHASHKSHTTQF